MDSTDVSNIVDLRDPVVLSIFVYTTARAGAMARLTCGDFHHDAEQWILHFNEEEGSRAGDFGAA